jgi:hypothetical protein
MILYYQLYYSIHLYKALQNPRPISCRTLEGQNARTKLCALKSLIIIVLMTGFVFIPHNFLLDKALAEGNTLLLKHLCHYYHYVT